MCGIAGIVKFGEGGHGGGGAESCRTALAAMSRTIAHRGPDGEGTYLDPRPGKVAALLHRRLAIIDRRGGQQPMPNEDGMVQVVFNGEIYNHIELRAELQQRGHVFRSHHSDTEVIVHGWEQWGEALPAKLRGMFAFAVWDARRDGANGGQRDTLFLARDRLGQKPLFYATLEDGLVFGSTIASVLAWPEVPRRVPRQQIALYLQCGYLPAPQTIFRDVSAVLPGHFVRLRRDVLDGGRYWENPRPGTAGTSHARRDVYAAATELRARLSRAVESQLIADVPVACFLSGGIDSSIVAALMQRAVVQQGGSRIRTISVGFAESAFDETRFAAAVAKKIGSIHTRLEVNAEADVIGTLRLLMRDTLGQPFADSSILPAFHLSKAARSVAPVALSGDGADELFGGYDRYRAMALLERWSGLARMMPRAMPLRSLPRRERYRRLAAAARESHAWTRYGRLLEIFPADTIEALLGATAEAEPPPVGIERLSAMRLAMLRDQADYLPNDVLWKVDAASMSPPPDGAAGGGGAAPLEVRAPFLDHSVVEFANALDDSLLVHKGMGKAILRQAFHDELPPVVRERGKKGFGVPIGAWFKTTLRPQVRELLTGAGSFVSQELAKPVVARILAEHESGARDHTHRIFALVMLELFWREFRPALE